MSTRSSGSSSSKEEQEQEQEQEHDASLLMAGSVRSGISNSSASPPMSASVLSSVLSSALASTSTSASNRHAEDSQSRAPPQSRPDYSETRKSTSEDGDDCDDEDEDDEGHDARNFKRRMEVMILERNNMEALRSCTSNATKDADVIDAIESIFTGEGEFDYFWDDEMHAEDETPDTIIAFLEGYFDIALKRKLIVLIHKLYKVRMGAGEEVGQRQPHSREDVEDYEENDEDEDEDEDYDPDTDEEEYDEYYDDDDYDDDDDDDDDDDGYAYADDHNCNCQGCSFLRIAGFGMESVGHFAHESCIANRREEEGGDSDEEDEDNDEEDEDDNDNDSSLCAICFHKQKTSNPFVALPCCDPNAERSNSTTQFCRKCITKTLHSQDTAHFHSPYYMYYTGECPRCRQVISVHKTLNSDLRTATFHEIIRYARYKGPGNAMRDTLIVCAYANHYHMPMELFRGEDDIVRQMVAWGVLERERKPEWVIQCLRLKHRLFTKLFQGRGQGQGNGMEGQQQQQQTLPSKDMYIYKMSLEHQIVLKEFIERCVLDEDDDSMHGLLISASDLCVAGIQSVLNINWWTASRLLSQSLTNCLIHTFFFPTLHKKWQEGIMMGVNLFLVLMVLLAGLFLLICAGICYMVIKGAGWLLMIPQKVKDSWDHCRSVGVRALVRNISWTHCVVYAVPFACGCLVLHLSYYGRPKSTISCLEDISIANGCKVVPMMSSRSVSSYNAPM